MNILVVDDEIVQLESLRRGLQSKGCKVLEALSARDALNLLENDKSGVDLVITDYAMPLMNGIDLLKNIRGKHGDLPIIIMTAYGRKDVMLGALQHQCNGFIEKPFTLDQLIHEIDRIKIKVFENMNRSKLSTSVIKLVHQINNPLMNISGSAELAMCAINQT